MFEAIDYLVFALHKAGLEEVIICPGSRNAPLTISLVRSGLFQTFSVADERSAGFIGLGKAIRTQKPVAVVCTSGSAVSNFYPAVVEAYYQRVPLVVLSADRPESLLDRWDGQTIHQKGIFGQHVKGSFSSPEDYTDKDSFLSVAEEAMSLALDGIVGPVHINIPLNEPLYPDTKRSFTIPEGYQFTQVIKQASQEQLPDLKGKRVLAIRGFDWKSQEKKALYPAQYADLMSGFPDSPIPEQVFMIQDEAIREQLKPEVIVSDGAAVLSKQLKQYLRKCEGVQHFHFSEVGDMADPFFTNPVLVQSNLDDFISEQSNEWDQTYVEGLIQISEECTGVLKSFIADGQGFNELLASHQILSSLPNEAVLHLSNSMPVRYASLLRPIVSKVYCNRGTSGIDGCVSTALGMAASNDATHYLMIGDIAFFYDSNALWNNLPKKNFKIILQNNGGGGIFRLIDGPSQQPELEQFFETSHTREARELCRNLNCHYFRAEDQAQLEKGLSLLAEVEGPALLEVFTNKLENQSFFNQYKEKINAVKISMGNHT